MFYHIVLIFTCLLLRLIFINDANFELIRFPCAIITIAIFLYFTWLPVHGTEPAEQNPHKPAKVKSRVRIEYFLCIEFKEHTSYFFIRFYSSIWSHRNEGKEKALTCKKNEMKDEVIKTLHTEDIFKLRVFKMFFLGVKNKCILKYYTRKKHSQEYFYRKTANFSWNESSIN